MCRDSAVTKKISGWQQEETCLWKVWRGGIDEKASCMNNFKTPGNYFHMFPKNRVIMQKRVKFVQSQGPDRMLSVVLLWLYDVSRCERLFGRLDKRLGRKNN